MKLDMTIMSVSGRMAAWCVLVACVVWLGGCGATRPDGNTPLSALADSIFRDERQTEIIVHDSASVPGLRFSTNGSVEISRVVGRDSWAVVHTASLGVPAVLPGASEAAANTQPVARESVLTSPVLELRRGVREILPSWNLAPTPGSGVRVEVRAGSTRLGRWTEWFDIGGTGVMRPVVAAPVVKPGSSDFGAKVDVDVLVLTGQLADRVQYRLIGYGTGPIFVSSVTICASVAQDPKLASAAALASPAQPLASPALPPVTGRLDLEFKTQRTQRSELSGRLCSPTSVAMVVGGATRLPLEVQTVAERAYDVKHDLYGNWPRNVQAAYELGARGFVTRYSTWAQVERTLARGIPIVASIRVKTGELRGAPYEKTDGHLIVIEGLDERGDVLVLDPAASDAKTGTLTYRREDMTRVWFGGSDGTAYVLLAR